MSARTIEFTPIIGPRGDLVHATSLTHEAGRTACNLICSGWRIALRGLDCKRCESALHLARRGTR